MPLFRTSFISYYLKRNINVNVFCPGLLPSEVDAGVKTHKVKDRYPVLYLLHGYWGSENSWLEYTSVARYAEEMQICIVTFAGENNSYVDMSDFRSDVSKKMFSPDYYDFIENELPDYVRSWFPVSHRMEDTYIAGLSMGGYGSLIHGLAHYRKYRAVGAFSPPTTLTQGRFGDYTKFTKAMKEKYEPLEVIRKAKALPSFYYSYGDKDYMVGIQDMFEEELGKMNIPHTFHKVEGYGHEWALWDKELERFLLWLPRTDAYAGSPRRSV